MAAGVWVCAHGHQPRLRPGSARVDQVPGRRRPGQKASRETALDRGRGSAGDHHPGDHLVFPDPAALEGGPAAHRRPAHAGAAAHRPSLRQLLRRHPHGRPGVAHHDRRGRRAQPDRHRPGRLCRRPAYRRPRLLHPDAHQRRDHPHLLRLRADLRLHPAQGIRRDPSYLPRARPHQCRGHRAA